MQVAADTQALVFALVDDLGPRTDQLRIQADRLGGRPGLLGDVFDQAAVCVRESLAVPSACYVEPADRFALIHQRKGNQIGGLDAI